MVGPRFTVRRLMIVVAVAALLLFAQRVYRRAARYRWAAQVYASEAEKERKEARRLDSLRFESAIRSAAYRRARADFMEEESRRFTRAAWAPWIDSRPGRPPRDPNSP